MGVIKTNKGTISFQIINNREVYVNSINHKIVENTLGRDLTSINFEEELILKVDSTITIGKFKFKINYINKLILDNVTYYVLKTCEKLTKTSTFLLPFLNLDVNQVNLNSYFINSFLVKEHKRFNNQIHLWYRFSNNSDYLEMEKYFLNLPNFVEYKDIDEVSVLYTLTVPEEHLSTVNQLIEGNYSKIHEIDKNKIIEFYKNTIIPNVEDILFKKESRRIQLEKFLEHPIAPEAELCDKFITEQETFYEERFKIKKAI